MCDDLCSQPQCLNRSVKIVAHCTGDLFVVLKI